METTINTTVNIFTKYTAFFTLTAIIDAIFFHFVTQGVFLFKAIA
jgi:hypothetical protein